MITHRKTMEDWADDNRVWIWMQGPKVELEALAVESLFKWSSLECGNPEPTYEDKAMSLTHCPCSMAFVFNNRADAALFKLMYS